MRMSNIMAAPAVAFLLVIALAQPAEAKHRNYSGASAVTAFCGDRYGSCNSSRAVVIEVVRRNARARSYVYDDAVIGVQPHGCPRRFCGCGLSLKLFGEIRPELNLASNWVKKFTRAHAAPGMAAVRRGGGHVMGLLSHVAGDDWLVYDANSGGGLTREHVRSIRGYVIVDPFSSRMTRLQ